MIHFYLRKNRSMSDFTVKTGLYYILFLFFVIASFHWAVSGREMHNKKNSIKKIMSLEDVNLDVNRLAGIYRNNGIWLFDAVANDWGCEWPKGSGNSPIFAAGQWIGAKINGEIRVSGVMHSETEFQSGMILEPFVADNPQNEEYRWYQLKGGGTGDWDSWPFDQGAPYYDSNTNGRYDPGEIPLLSGDHSIFSIWNDLCPHIKYGSDSLSAEIRQYVFAFNNIDVSGDMHFIRWYIINKSGIQWDSTYFCIWLDPDLGSAVDDLVGCDSSLHLGFCYNANNNDLDYGSAPPAVGVCVLQGPIINNPDSILLLPDDTVLPGKEMLRSSSFIIYYGDDSPQGEPRTAGDVWYFFQARWRDGQKMTEGDYGRDPDNKPTNYMFSGDPETQTGWLDSVGGDRKFIMNIGPFDLEPWDDKNGNQLADFGEPGVQVIAVAVMVARGTDNLNSVTVLKSAMDMAKSTYNQVFINPYNYTSINEEKQAITRRSELDQNWPNPFNSTTCIPYTIHKRTTVKLVIYDLLGREIFRLVDHMQNPGQYTVHWNAANYASGIYYYHLITDNFMQVKKLLLLR
jgi:hypothetical protein